MVRKTATNPTSNVPGFTLRLGPTKPRARAPDGRRRSGYRRKLIRNRSQFPKKKMFSAPERQGTRRPRRRRRRRRRRRAPPLPPGAADGASLPRRDPACGGPGSPGGGGGGGRRRRRGGAVAAAERTGGPGTCPTNIASVNLAMGCSKGSFFSTILTRALAY